MEEIKILGKTINEITDRYFDSSFFKKEYDMHEQNLVKEGFREGIEYLYPLYESAIRLTKAYERLEKVREEQKY